MIIIHTLLSVKYCFNDTLKPRPVLDYFSYIFSFVNLNQGFLFISGISKT